MVPGVGRAEYSVAGQNRMIACSGAHRAELVVALIALVLGQFATPITCQALLRRGLLLDDDVVLHAQLLDHVWVWLRDAPFIGQIAPSFWRG